MTTSQAEPFVIRLSQILLESADFRHSNSDFLNEDPRQPVPETPAQIEVQAVLGEEGTAIVRLRVSCSAPDAPYHFSASYLVLLEFEGKTPEDFQRRIAITGATMAMPFVREVTANLSGRGRFGPTWLAPVNMSDVVRDTNVVSSAGHK